MAWQRKAIFVVYVMWFNADSDKKRPLRSISVPSWKFLLYSFLLILARLALHLSARLLLCVSPSLSSSFATLFIFPHTMCVLCFNENSEYTLKVLLDIFLNCVQQNSPPPPRNISPRALSTHPVASFAHTRFSYAHTSSTAYLVAESLSLCTTLFNVISIWSVVATQTHSLSFCCIHIHTCTYVIPLQCATTWTLIKFLRQPEYIYTHTILSLYRYVCVYKHFTHKQLVQNLCKWTKCITTTMTKKRIEQISNKIKPSSLNFRKLRAKRENRKRDRCGIAKKHCQFDEVSKPPLLF